MRAAKRRRANTDAREISAEEEQNPDVALDELLASYQQGPQRQRAKRSRNKRDPSVPAIAPDGGPTATKPARHAAIQPRRTAGQQGHVDQDNDRDLRVPAFDFRRVRPHCLSVVLHADPVRAANCTEKLLRHHKDSLEAGEVYTRMPSVIHTVLPQLQCQPAHALDTDHLKDTYARQAIQMRWQPTPELQAQLDQTPTSGVERKELLRRVKPLHLLPSSVFEDRMPERLFDLVNRFIMIPLAYLVVHHVGETPTDVVWARQMWLRKCLLDPTVAERLTRIVTVDPAAVGRLPPAFLQRCNYLLVFTRDPNVLRALYRRAKLCSMFANVQSLLRLAALLTDRQGLVLLPLRTEGSPGNGTTEKSSGHCTGEFDPKRVFWMSDVIRSPPALTV